MFTMTLRSQSYQDLTEHVINTSWCHGKRTVVLQLKNAAREVASSLVRRGLNFPVTLEAMALHHIVFSRPRKKCTSMQILSIYTSVYTAPSEQLLTVDSDSSEFCERLAA